ncbi:ABC transporter substrate-binding protein [Dictyobacter kobayashii]|uniref:Sugar ABC transporter substrate-binding protein n=1 Tax=Dictyobacter kobayashii TaxID=2014872 RepID=A0A402AYX0_9CHLR|nr:ABC transporter substrate-binding protein [Dictyobacter kobayashii]GCE24278.1 sugar ABC transporter substrate-binding protein [Dictyobacter kobayashii]
MSHSKLWHTGTSVLMSLLLIPLLAACGTTSNTGGGSTASSTCSSPPKLTKTSHLKVGFSQEVNNAPWRIAETTSIQEEASKRGDTVIYTDANNSDSKQVSDIQSIIAQRPDVILIAPLTEDGEVSAIKQARAACIPVFLVDRDANHAQVTPGKDYVTFIGSDFVKEGQRVADYMIQATKGTAKIIELQGTTGSSPAIARGKGFDDEVASHPGMQIVAKQDGNFDRATGLAKMQTLLQAHPDVTAVYAHNDEMALGAIQALKAAGKIPGKDVLVGSIDGENEALQDVQSGTEGVVVQCNPRLGPIAFDTIDAYAKGQTPAPWIVQQDNEYTKANAAQAISQGLGF